MIRVSHFYYHKKGYWDYDIQKMNMFVNEILEGMEGCGWEILSVNAQMNPLHPDTILYIVTYKE